MMWRKPKRKRATRMVERLGSHADSRASTTYAMLPNTTIGFLPYQQSDQWIKGCRYITMKAKPNLWSVRGYAWHYFSSSSINTLHLRLYLLVRQVTVDWCSHEGTKHVHTLKARLQVASTTRQIVLLNTRRGEMRTDRHTHLQTDRQTDTQANLGCEGGGESGVIKIKLYTLFDPFSIWCLNPVFTLCSVPRKRKRKKQGYTYYILFLKCTPI